MRVGLLFLLGLCAASSVDRPTLALRVSSGPAAALLNNGFARGDRDLPDAPARAIRLKDGTVQLYATNRENRVNVGPDLLHLEHRCPVVFRGGDRDNPAAYDDRAWIASPWTPDGRTVLALVHNGFHGHLRPELCPTGRYMDCWFNALTLAVSHEGGRHYQRAPGDALVAALPYHFDQVGLGHHGYLNPSNIVSMGDDRYIFAFATGANAQKNGNCLLRTHSIGDVQAWRGWDGRAFNVELVNPYRESNLGLVEPERHVCASVDVGHLRWPVTSLVRHAPTETFIALMQSTAPGGGVFYATSPDLLRWSEPVLLLPAVG